MRHKSENSILEAYHFFGLSCIHKLSQVWIPTVAIFAKQTAGEGKG